jgi:hypothetical protein
MNFNVAGGLATYDFYSQYVELAGRMFGAYMNYTWNPVTKKLQLIRDPKGTGENVLLWVYQTKPEIQLLSDYQISQWIRDYMVGACKMIIGEAREKFALKAKRLWMPRYRNWSCMWMQVSHLPGLLVNTH